MLSDCDRQQGFQCTCHQQACFSSAVLSWSFSSFFDLIQTHWSSFQIHWSFFQNHWRSSLNPHCFPPRSHCPILYRHMDTVHIKPKTNQTLFFAEISFHITYGLNFFSNSHCQLPASLFAADSDLCCSYYLSKMV